MRVFLVACSGTKAPTPCEARDLYQGQLFLAARRYVEATRDPWRILSAQHRLVQPDQVLEPYDLALADLRVDDRKLWHRRVEGDVIFDLTERLGFNWKRPGASFEAFQRGEPLPPGRWLPTRPRYVLLAGRDYCEPLADGLRDRDLSVELPLAGLGIGRQKQWLAQALRDLDEPKLIPEVA